jgi:hypothetical protein
MQSIKRWVILGATTSPMHEALHCTVDSIVEKKQYIILSPMYRPILLYIYSLFEKVDKCRVLLPGAQQVLYTPSTCWWPKTFKRYTSIIRLPLYI